MARTGREANGWAAGDLLLMFGEFGLVKLDEHIIVIYIYKESHPQTYKFPGKKRRFTFLSFWG